MRLVCLGTLLATSLWAASADVEARVKVLQEVARELEQHNATAAETMLNQLLSESPHDAVALNLLGLVKLEQNSPSDAEKLFRQAIADSHDQIVGPHINLARLEMNSDPLGAIGELKAALAIKPDNAQTQWLLSSVTKNAAESALRAGDSGKALAIAQRARETSPHDPEILYDAGLIKLDCHDYAGSENALEQALQKKHDFAEARYALARAYMAQSKASQAETEMRKYLNQKPDDATAQYGLGFILLAEQQLNAARIAFEKSLALQPNQTESVFELGEISLREGDTANAVVQFDQVLAKDPRHGGALTELGAISFQAADYTAAKKRLEDAIACAPSFQKAHYYYALTLSKLGNKEEARRQFEISKTLQKEHGPEGALVPLQQ